MDNFKAVDYSKQCHWLSLPISGEKEVDVFYIYPTVLENIDNDDLNVCKIDNASMIAGAKQIFSSQANAFETVGNIYAPYYRQADKKILSWTEKERCSVMEGLPKSDIFAAFDYYIRHYNNGRPFILASHSQGSMLMKYLLSEYMKEHPDVYHRMIAAYVIGYSVTADYLAQNPHLKFAEGPDDTGVIISYNTEAPIIDEPNPVVLSNSIAINPLTWTREETLATARESLGSIIIKNIFEIVDPLVTNYADACVDKARGVIICSSIDANEVSSGVFPKGVYHLYDYPFYFYNLRENAANRTKNFLKTWQWKN